MSKKIISLDSSITEKAIRSAKWSFLTDLVTKLTSPIVALILARLLSPSDFGVVATAMIAISFTQMISDAGLTKSLIQIEDDKTEAAHVVFWSNLILGVATYVLLFFVAPTVSIFFESPQTEPVLRILGLQVVIGCFAGVQQALMVREFEFRTLFFIKLLTLFIPAMFAIPLAFWGYGCWALVAGVLSGQVLNLVVLWSWSRWRPKLVYNVVIAKRMLRFGAWVVLESVLGWFYLWGDNLVVGRFFGVGELGLYQTGWNVALLGIGFTLSPLLPVIYPTFSRYKKDLASIKNNFFKANRIVIAIALPMGIGLFLTGPEVGIVLFGDKWLGVGDVISIFGLMFGLSWLVGINPEIYRAMGHPHVMPKLMLIAALYYVPAYLLAAYFNFTVFLYVRLLLGVTALPLHIFVCQKMFQVSPFYLWEQGKHFMLASLLMGLLIVGIKTAFVNNVFSPISPILYLAIVIPLGVVVYFSTLWVLDKSFVSQAYLMMRKSFAS